MLAYPWLFGRVQAQFELDKIPVPNYFGWRTRDEQDGGESRILWEPGDQSGNTGELLPPSKRNDGNPRSLGTLEELFTVTIVGFDPEAPEDEKAQYTATRLLYDDWYRAVCLTIPGNFRIIANNWLNKKKLRAHGAAIEVILALNTMIPDKAQTVAPVDTKADIDTSVLDNTEQTTTTEGP